MANITKLASEEYSHVFSLPTKALRSNHGRRLGAAPVLLRNIACYYADGSASTNFSYE